VASNNTLIMNTKHENSSKKKTKSKVGKILTWSGVSLLVLLLVIICIPFFFKDKIKDLVLKEIDKMLVAEVKLDDFDLTLFSTFPNLSVQLHGLEVVGKDDFEGVKLADIKTLRADVGLWDVIKGDDAISIDAIYLKEPKIDVRILPDGKANYDIMKPDSLKTPEEIEEPSNFQLELKKYTIEKAQVRYSDKQGGLFAKITDLTHQGKGDLSADIVDFKTKTSTEELTFEMDGIPYLSKVKTDIIANLLLEFHEKDSKFTLQKNSFQLNDLQFSLDGFYHMFENHDLIDLDVKTDKISFKELISLIPAFYKTGYESMLASGNVELFAKVKGQLDDVNLPGWDAGLKVANASIKYPDLPGKIENIAVDARSQFAGGSKLDNMTVDVDKFHLDFVGNVVDATLKLRNIVSDPQIKSTLLAKVDLASVKQIMPLDEGEKYEGKLKADIQLDGKMSHIEKEQYDQFKALGMLQLNDFIYESPELSQEVKIQEVLFRFAPQYLALDKLDAKMGKSDFALNGTVDNYMGYLFRDELLKGKFNLTSRFMDLDELMNVVPASESEATEQGENTPTNQEGTEEGIEIPGNIDFKLNTNISKARFNGIDMHDIRGEVLLKDRKASLSDLTLRAMGGNIGLSGDYDTKNPAKPKANFGYRLDGLNIQELSSNFLTVEKLAPITKHVSGKISSHFNMSTDLTPNLDPLLASINGAGDFSSALLKLSDVKVMDKISEATKLKNLNNQTLNNVKTRFKIEDGAIEIQPFDILMGDIKTNVSGKMGLDQNINYDLKMTIPREKIPKEMIQLVEQATAKVNSLAPKLNVNLIPNEIPINVKVVGTVSDPKVTTNFKEKLLEATGNAKDALINEVKDKVNETIDKAKDSVKAVVTDAVDKAKEELEKQKQQMLSNAQKQADNIKSEGKKAADRIRSEADKGYQQAVDAAGSNPLKKKAAEMTAQKVKEQAYKKATQAENEANTRADDLLNKAKQEANKLK